SATNFDAVAGVAGDGVAGDDLGVGHVVAADEVVRRAVLDQDSLGAVGQRGLAGRVEADPVALDAVAIGGIQVDADARVAADVVAAVDRVIGEAADDGAAGAGVDQDAVAGV